MRKGLWAIPMVMSFSMFSAAGSAWAGGDHVNAATMVHNETKQWMKIDTMHKTVTLKVVADASDENSGHNFDGYSKGGMQVRVPRGWKVLVRFQNNSATTPHSLMIVPYKQRNLESGFTTVFPGASTPSPTQGITQGTTESFHFKANKSGTFAMICGVPGHSEFGGMWDKFTVSSKFKRPSILVADDNRSSNSGSGSGSDPGYGGY